MLVHGDFGPQNVLLDPETAVPTALVDWELTHIGHPVEDLAWAEWIVRTHHAAVVDRLPALFDGYGDRPAWADRHAAMIDKCHWALDFVGRWESGILPRLPSGGNGWPLRSRSSSIRRAPNGPDRAANRGR